MPDLLGKVEAKCLKKKVPEFNVGDVVDVHVKIKEGEKERVQVFTGTVLKIRGGKGISGSFTVRRIVQSEGVERVFPFHCPSVRKVTVKRPGAVRRAKLYYLRERTGKATKVKERREYARSAADGKKKGAKKKTKKTRKSTAADAAEAAGSTKASASKAAPRNAGGKETSTKKASARETSPKKPSPKKAAAK